MKKYCRMLRRLVLSISGRLVTGSRKGSETSAETTLVQHCWAHQSGDVLILESRPRWESLICNTTSWCATTAWKAWSSGVKAVVQAIVSCTSVITNRWRRPNKQLLENWFYWYADIYIYINTLVAELLIFQWPQITFSAGRLVSLLQKEDIGV